MFTSDVLVKGGKIVDIQPSIEAKDNMTVIDASSKYVLPGGIDPHTHLDFEFMGTKTIDDFSTGTEAAIKGATTMVIDFIVPRIGESLLSAYNRYVKKAEGNAKCDYGFHMAITWWSDKVAKEMEEITKKGINSFKMFMAYKDMLMVNDAELFQAFSRCKELGALPMVHAENGSIIAENAKKIIANGITGPEGHDLSRPEDVEAEATNRACVIAKMVDSPLYVVHVMTDAAAKVIGEHKKNGKVQIIGETLAAAVGSTGAPKGCSFHVAAAHVMSPPISHDPTNRIKMLKHLSSEVLSCVGSDNCTFTTEQKEQMGKECFTKIPNGVNGVEDRMAVVWQKGVTEGYLSCSEFVAVTSTNTAKIFNIYPRKGAIAVGSDADIVVWDKNAKSTISKETHKQATDFNIFEGMKIEGGPTHVMVGGKLVYKDKEFTRVKTVGRFVETPCFCSAVYPKTV
ncbi:dihydropyrimidinase-like isoform X2 [Rhodnius prolixus]